MKEKKIILFAVIAVIIATLLYVVYAYTEHDHERSILNRPLPMKNMNM